jgi:two-component system, cell cycle sensor histidine kinase and response regulator CckA
LNTEATPPTPPTKPKATILVVDDEEALLEFIKEVLAAAGYTVQTAVNPLKAMAWLESVQWKVDLIVSDILMPEMDGLSFLQIVRRHSTEVALLLISAYVIAEDLWGEHSRIPFLAKPFRQQELIHAVEDCLAQHRGSRAPF